MWFTENAWQPMLLLTLLGMIAGMVWYRRLQKRYLVVMLVCFLLVGVTWVVERTIVTPREQIHDSIHAMTSAFQNKDLPGTVQYVSQRSEGLRLLIGFASSLVTIEEDMRVTDIEIETKNKNTRATARFRVNATFVVPNQNLSSREPTRWEATWQLESQEWKMIDISMIDPITGNHMDDFRMLRNQLVASERSANRSN